MAFNLLSLDEELRSFSDDIVTVKEERLVGTASQKDHIRADLINQVLLVDVELKTYTDSADHILISDDGSGDEALRVDTLAPPLLLVGVPSQKNKSEAVLTTEINPVGLSSQKTLIDEARLVLGFEGIANQLNLCSGDITHITKDFVGKVSIQISSIYGDISYMEHIFADVYQSSSCNAILEGQRSVEGRSSQLNRIPDAEITERAYLEGDPYQLTVINADLEEKLNIDAHCASVSSVEAILTHKAYFDYTNVIQKTSTYGVVEWRVYLTGNAEQKSLVYGVIDELETHLTGLSEQLNRSITRLTTILFPIGVASQRNSQVTNLTKRKYLSGNAAQLNHIYSYLAIYPIHYMASDSDRIITSQETSEDFIVSDGQVYLNGSVSQVQIAIGNLEIPRQTTIYLSTIISGLVEAIESLAPDQKIISGEDYYPRTELKTYTGGADHVLRSNDGSGDEYLIFDDFDDIVSEQETPNDSIVTTGDREPIEVPGLRFREFIEGGSTQLSSASGFLTDKLPLTGYCNQSSSVNAQMILRAVSYGQASQLSYTFGNTEQNVDLLSGVHQLSNAYADLYLRTQKIYADVKELSECNAVLTKKVTIAGNSIQRTSTYANLIHPELYLIGNASELSSIDATLFVETEHFYGRARERSSVYGLLDSDERLTARIIQYTSAFGVIYNELESHVGQLTSVYAYPPSEKLEPSPVLQETASFGYLQAERVFSGRASQLTSTYGRIIEDNGFRGESRQENAIYADLYIRPWMVARPVQLTSTSARLTTTKWGFESHAQQLNLSTGDLLIETRALIASVEQRTSCYGYLKLFTEEFLVGNANQSSSINASLSVYNIFLNGIADQLNFVSGAVERLRPLIGLSEQRSSMLARMEIGIPLDAEVIQLTEQYSEVTLKAVSVGHSSQLSSSYGDITSKDLLNGISLQLSSSFGRMTVTTPLPIGTAIQRTQAVGRIRDSNLGYINCPSIELYEGCDSSSS